MDLPGPGSTPAAGRRAVTPAVLLATAFTTLCAIVSIGFVAARGGLELPVVGPVASAVARASQPPTATPTATSTAPSVGPATAEPSPSNGPSEAPSPGPTSEPTPAGTPDPLTALPACPDHPGCYEYTIRRGDALSTIADHWLISIQTLQALNPQITDPSTIVVGHVLFLGRSPFVTLDACPDAPACYFYVVRPGDRLSTIAGRYGITTEAILQLNPRITDPNAIYSGQTIRLPDPVPAPR